MLRIGQHVRFTDPSRIEHDALITAVWDGREKAWTDEGTPTIDDPDTATVNLILVSGDEREHDQYGRQTRHETSVPNAARTTAPGYCWKAAPVLTPA